MKHLPGRRLPELGTPFTSPARVMWIIVAVATFAALLLAFQQVVRSGIEHGVERRALAVQQLAAANRCTALATARIQEQCLLALSAAPRALPGAATSTSAPAADVLVENPVDDGLMAGLVNH